MKSYFKKIFNLNLIIKIRNFLNLRPVSIDKSKLGGKVSISDSFCWRTDNNFRTIIRFSDILKTFYNIDNTQVQMIIYSKDFQLIKKINFDDIKNLNEYVISKETLNGLESYGTFFLFHKFIDKEKSDIFISNRCYLGFSRNENLYSYVHGNTLSKYVNMENFSDIKSDLVQNTFLKYSSKYKVQNYFDGNSNNEIFLANPTSKKIKYKVNNVSKTLKNGESIIIKISGKNTVLIESNCLFFRPIVFSSKNEYLDVYHG